MFILLDDMIANMEANRKLKPVVAEMFTRGRKLIISSVFISQSYFAVPKTIILNLKYNTKHYFIMRKLIKR